MTHSPNDIAVLRGGWSAERQVSLNSGAAVIAALKSNGHAVRDVVVEKDVADFLAKMTPKPRLAFNTLHGTGGEDGVIQGVLEMLEIPSPQSSVTASALAMDKALTRNIFQQNGIPVAEGVVMPRKEVMANPPFPAPYVVKLLREGSSVGVQIIMEDGQQPDMPADDVLVLVEKYIPGREVFIAVLNDRAFPLIEMRTNRAFYDYEAKYGDQTASGTTFTEPTDLSPDLVARLQGFAVKAHQVLGCSGLTRTDVRLDNQLNPFVLELNTQPGLTDHSLAPMAAAKAGVDFPALIEAIIAPHQ